MESGKLGVLRGTLCGSGAMVLAIGIGFLLQGRSPQHRFSHPELAFWGSLLFQGWGLALLAVTTIGWKGFRNRIRGGVNSAPPRSPSR